MAITGSVTTTQARTLYKMLIDCDPNYMADLFRQMQLGNMMQTFKVTFVGLTTATAHNITDSGHAAGASGVTVNLPSGYPLAEQASALPAIGVLVALRDTGGATGVYVAGDTGCTPFDASGSHPGVVKLSDDGTTITFNTTTTGFVIEYIPRSAVALTTTFNDMI